MNQRESERHIIQQGGDPQDNLDSDQRHNPAKRPTARQCLVMCMSWLRGGDDVIMARQRVLRFLTPNPNSAEGVLWSEASGRAVASLEYELRLERIGRGGGRL